MSVADPSTYQAGARLSVRTVGLAPVVLCVGIAASLLWGIGVDSWLELPESNVRTAFTWAAVAALMLIVTAPLASRLTRAMTGDRPSRPGRLRALAVGRQQRRRTAVVDRDFDRDWRHADLVDLTAAVVEEFTFGPGGVQLPGGAPEEEVRGQIRRTVERVVPTRVQGLASILRMVGTVLKELADGPPSLLLRIDLRDQGRAISQDILARIQSPAVALRFPLSEEVEPTQLRNADVSVADRLRRRYGMDLATILPRLVAVLPETDRLALSAAARRVQLAVTVAVGWFLGGAWLFVAILGTAGAWRPWALSVAVAAGAAAGPFSLSRSAYNDAVDRTVVLGQAVEAAVDLHRLDLLDAMGWRRPRDTADEKAMFMALTATYSGGRAAAQYRRWDNDQAAPLPDESLLRTIGELPGQLADSVRAGVRTGLREDLAPAVERTLRNSLRGPVLDNYDGHLSVGLLEDDEVVPIGDDGSAAVRWGRRHDLSVIIGPDATGDGLTAPLRLRGGNDAATVRFEVTVESNVPALRQQSRTVDVAARRPVALTFRLDLAAPGQEAPWIWVQVSQRDRTLQSLELTLLG